MTRSVPSLYLLSLMTKSVPSLHLFSMMIRSVPGPAHDISTPAPPWSHPMHHFITHIHHQIWGTTHHILANANNYILLQAPVHTYILQVRIVQLLSELDGLRMMNRFLYFQLSNSSSLDSTTVAIM